MAKNLLLKRRLRQADRYRGFYVPNQANFEMISEPLVCEFERVVSHVYTVSGLFPNSVLFTAQWLIMLDYTDRVPNQIILASLEITSIRLTIDKQHVHAKIVNNRASIWTRTLVCGEIGSEDVLVSLNNILKP